MHDPYTPADCPRCREIHRNHARQHTSGWRLGQLVENDYLLRRARQIQAQPTPRFNGTRNAELTELAHAYGISLRTLQRYLAK